MISTLSHFFRKNIINRLFYQNKSNQVNQLVSILQLELGQKEIDPSLPLSSWGLNSLQRLHVFVLLTKYLNTPFNLQQFPMQHTLEYLLNHYPLNMAFAPDSSSQHVPLVFQFNPKELKILRLMQCYPDNPAYQIGLCIEINEVIDVALFKKAIQRVHETSLCLRLQFNAHELTKVINSSPLLPFQYESIETLSTSEQHEYIQSRFLARTEQFCHLVWPLYQIDLLQTSAKKQVLIVAMHHLISDGVSLLCYVQKVLDAYHNLPVQQDLDAITNYFKCSQLPITNPALLTALISEIQKISVSRFLPVRNPDTNNYESVTHRVRLAMHSFEKKYLINAYLLQAITEILLNSWKKEYLLLKINTRARKLEQLKLIAYFADATIYCASRQNNSLSVIQKFIGSLTTTEYPSYETVVDKLSEPGKELPEICYNFIDLRFAGASKSPFKLYPITLPKTTMWADEIKLTFEIFVTEDCVDIVCSGRKRYFSQEQLQDLIAPLEKIKLFGSVQ